MSRDEPLDRSMTTSTTLDIPRVVRLAREGHIRIPKFQRGFVWDASDVRRFFDSLYRGFPIGTLLLWQQPAQQGPVAFGPLELTVPAVQDALWVVDGQQRVTSLVGTLTEEGRNVDERFELFFDLARRRFVGPLRGSRPARAIPVREVLESRRLISWLREHGEDLEADDYEVADELGGALRDYRLPAYVVEGNDDSILRVVFDRVNSAGKPITRAQVFHALFASESQVGSPGSVTEELRRHRFGTLDESRVVQSLLAIRGGDVQRDVHEEFDDDEDPSEWYNRTEEALTRSILFLRGQGVPHLALTPSTFPLPVLAAFFYRHQEPSPWVVQLLAKWLWRGWVHGFGREGGQTPALRRSIRAIAPRKLMNAADPTEYEAVRLLLEAVKDAPAPAIGMQAFRTDKANPRLVLLALASLGPQAPDGQPINLSEVLDDLGVDAIGELLPGARSDGAARGFWLPTWRRPTGSEPDPVLASHAITGEAAAALRQGDRQSFLESRRHALDNLVQKFLNARLDPGATLRPPLAELFVPDPDSEVAVG